MRLTKRPPVSVGETTAEVFLPPLMLTQAAMDDAARVSRKTVNELCTNKRKITADTALILARVFGNTAEFWMNLQQRNELRQALNTPERRRRIDQARPLQAHAA